MLCFILLATTLKVDIAESNWNDQSAQNAMSKTIVVGEATQNTPSDSNKTVTIESADTTQIIHYDMTHMVNSTQTTLYDTTEVDYESERTFYDTTESVYVTQATLYDSNETGNTTQITYVFNATTATLNAYLETVNATGSGNDDMYFVYLPFGVISIAGNIMIIIIMSTSDNRGKSTSLLFIILAISDTSLTINNMFYSYVQAANVAGFTETEDRSLIFGIMTNLIWRINVHFSNYVLVVITLERVIGIAIPFHVKTICRRKYLFASITIILIVLAVANIPLWVRDWPSGNMENLELLDLVLGFSLPFLAILVGGLYIIVKVKYGLLSSSPYNSSVTNIVIGAILAFLVTMLPRRIVYLIETGSADEDKENFLIIIFQGLESLNTGVNFFVYILAGRKFRDDFVNFVLRRTKKSTSQSISKIQTIVTLTSDT